MKSLVDKHYGVGELTYGWSRTAAEYNCVMGVFVYSQGTVLAQSRHVETEFGIAGACRI